MDPVEGTVNDLELLIQASSGNPSLNKSSTIKSVAKVLVLLLVNKVAEPKQALSVVKLALGTSRTTIFPFKVSAHPLEFVTVTLTG